MSEVMAEYLGAAPGDEEEGVVTIGSSDVPVILGIDRYRTVWELWPRLVGLMPRYDNRDAPVMATGRLVERLIIPEIFRQREGVELVPGPPLSEPGVVGPEEWQHARHDFTRADNGHVVEAKKIRSWKFRLPDGSYTGWGPDGSDGLPPDHLAQVMWQQHIVKPAPAQLAAWNVMDESARIYEVGFRAELVASLVTNISNWYERHVIECIPPTVDSTPECGRNLALLYPGRRAKIWRNPEAADIALGKDIARLRSQIEELDERRRGAEAKLRERIGNDYGIRGVARWVRSGKGRSLAFIYQPEIDEEVEL